jgi:hypothetical protein
MPGRFARLITSFVATVSFLFLLICAAAWAVSLFRTDALLIHAGENTTYLLAQSKGEFLVAKPMSLDSADSSAPGPTGIFSHTEMPKNCDITGVIWLLVSGDRESSGAGSHGFGYMKQTDAIPGEQASWAVVWPHWAMLLLSSFLPVTWSLRWLNRRRRAMHGFRVETVPQPAK